MDTPDMNPLHKRREVFRISLDAHLTRPEAERIASEIAVQFGARVTLTGWIYDPTTGDVEADARWQTLVRYNPQVTRGPISPRRAAETFPKEDLPKQTL